jgi:hypothetical protein
MNKRDIFSDEQLLEKIAGRLVTISLRTIIQKTARRGEEPMERDAPPLPFLYQG